MTHVKILTIISMMVLLMCGGAVWAENAITLETAIGADNGLVFIGTSVEWQFRWTVDLEPGSKVEGYLNTFKVYSPDGAIWDTTTAEYLPAWYSGTDFEKNDIFLWGGDGIGADTAIFFGQAMWTAGAGYNFSDVVWSVSAVIPNDPALLGKTLCIDSIWFPLPAWSWGDGTEDVHPGWDGPHCYMIAESPPQPIVKMAAISGVQNDQIAINSVAEFGFTLRTDTLLDPALLSYANAFRIYSPDGAYWDTAYHSYLPAWPPADASGFDGGTFLNSYSANGSGADTLEFSGLITTGPGLPMTYGTLGWKMVIELPDDASLIGKTICIDSVQVVSGHDGWKWSDASGDISPWWYSPTCFEIVESLDLDSDSVPDLLDNCPLTANTDQADLDGDLVGDACDPCTDTDGDGYGNPGYAASTCPVDNCPSVPNPLQEDTDGDGEGDACDACPNSPIGDPDTDGLCGDVDNCPLAYNPEQTDSDGDLVGDVCDNCPEYNPDQADVDEDGVGDLCDLCPDDYDPEQIDIDGDGFGDVCDVCPEQHNDIDADLDGMPDLCDNCPTDYNADQQDSDNDGIGDVCDVCPYDDEDDADSDGLCADADNCPNVYNPDQANADGDDRGDACDSSPDICCNGDYAGNIDCDAGDNVDISDLTVLVNYLFITFEPLCCAGEANVNGDLDGNIDIADLSWLVYYLFIGFPGPPLCM